MASKGACYLNALGSLAELCANTETMVNPEILEVDTLKRLDDGILDRAVHPLGLTIIRGMLWPSQLVGDPVLGPEAKTG